MSVEICNNSQDVSPLNKDREIMEIMEKIYFLDPTIDESQCPFSGVYRECRFKTGRVFVYNTAHATSYYMEEGGSFEKPDSCEGCVQSLEEHMARQNIWEPPQGVKERMSLRLITRLDEMVQRAKVSLRIIMEKIPSNSKALRITKS